MYCVYRGISFCRYAWISRNLRRFYHTKSPEEVTKEVTRSLPGAVSQRYKVFDENQSPKIFDVDEERARVQEEELEVTGHDPYEGISLQRGTSGVFEIEDLVKLLQKEKGRDILVCRVPPELKYVDYMCITTALSVRHMRGLAEFVRKVYKIKRLPGDNIPKIEGVNCKDWIAMDMGNIALHIFSAQSRRLYDLDSLWTVGPDFDPECNKPVDPLLVMMEHHTNLLSGVTK